MKEHIKQNTIDILYADKCEVKDTKIILKIFQLYGLCGFEF